MKYDFTIERAWNKKGWCVVWIRGAQSFTRYFLKKAYAQNFVAHMTQDEELLTLAYLESYYTGENNYEFDNT